MSDAEEANGKQSESEVKPNDAPRFWDRCLTRPYVLAFSGTALLGLVIFGNAIWPALVSEFKFTTTLTAVTQSFSIRTLPGGSSVWVLPPGTYSMIGGAEREGCDKQDFELLCVSDTNLKVMISGQADLTWRTTPDGSWTFSAMGAGDPDLKISVTTGTDDAIESDQFITYRADNAALPVRHPFVATEVTVGEDLHESSAELVGSYSFWQPALLSGDIQMIANNKPSLEKYQVLATRIDPGDVVRVSHSEPQEEAGKAAIWGLLSTRPETDSSGSVGPPFDVTLHTSERQLNVSRFGAPDGHIIRASSWSIWRSWPIGQAAWVRFVSLVLILTFAMQLGQVLCERKARND